MVSLARCFAGLAAFVAVAVAVQPGESRHEPESLNAERAVTRDFAKHLVARLVRDLEIERETGWLSPASERFRNQLIYSSEVLDSWTLLTRVQSSGALMSQVTLPSTIQESAMQAVLEISFHRYARLLLEIREFKIPEGPDHPDEFQPRAQAGGAVGGTFSEFSDDEERMEYEQNYEMMRRRNQYKALKAYLERDLVKLEADLQRLVRSIDSMCDTDGRVLLRQMIDNASSRGVDFAAILSLEDTGMTRDE